MTTVPGIAALVAVAGVATGGVVMAVLAGALALGGVGAAARWRLLVDGRGVHHRSPWPNESWTVPWEALLGVAVDKVSSKGRAQGRYWLAGEFRLQFSVRRDRPRQVVGLSRRACEAVVQRFASRGLDVQDLAPRS